MVDLSWAQSSAWRDPSQKSSGRETSVFEVLTCWRPSGIAGQEAEDEYSNEEEDDRVNGELEGEHGDRSASSTSTTSYGV